MNRIMLKHTVRPKRKVPRDHPARRRARPAGGGAASGAPPESARGSEEAAGADAGFVKGANVLGLWQGHENDWHAGKITKVWQSPEGENVYDMLYDSDGATEEGMEAKCVALDGATAEFGVGDDVEAQYQGRHKKYSRGTIDRVNYDDSRFRDETYKAAARMERMTVEELAEHGPDGRAAESESVAGGGRGGEGGAAGRRANGAPNPTSDPPAPPVVSATSNAATTGVPAPAPPARDETPDATATGATATALLNLLSNQLVRTGAVLGEAAKGAMQWFGAMVDESRSNSASNDETVDEVDNLEYQQTISGGNNVLVEDGATPHCSTPARAKGRKVVFEAVDCAGGIAKCRVYLVNVREITLATIRNELKQQRQLVTEDFVFLQGGAEIVVAQEKRIDTKASCFGLEGKGLPTNPYRLTIKITSR